MNTKALNALADVICRAQEQDRTPMGIAFAVDSAGMHMSPETAADQEQLRLRVDEVERKYIFDTAELKRQLESSRVDGQRLIRAEQRRAELEAVLSTHRKDDQAEIARLRSQVAKLKADRADEYDELAMALGHSNGTEWGDLIEFAAGAVSAEAKLRARVAELEAWKARDEEVQPHRQAIGAANMRMIGALELRIRRVRMLHSKGWGAESERCEHDGEPWPCRTLAALDAAVGEAKRKPSVEAPTQALREDGGASC